MKKTINNNINGITLIALVITIIVLLILAGVAISMLSGENGILKQAAEAKTKTEKAKAEEQSQLSQMNNQLKNLTDKGFEKSKNVNRPQLTTGMTRVMYKEGKTILDGQSGWNEDNWYSYTTTNKNWANAQTKDGSMWVWIPRFAYYIDSNKNMKIKFLVGTTNTWYDETTEEYKELPSGYIVHPAFKDGKTNNYANGEWKEEITGFWMAKFQAGLPNESTAPKTTSVSEMTDSYYPVFQGQKGAYNYIDISQCFLLSKAISENGNPYGITNADSHLTKNSEWGAVAYLSYSEYGKTGGTYNTEKEVYINNVTYGGTQTSVRNYGIYAVTGYAGEERNATANTLIADCNLSDIVVGEDKNLSYAWYTNEGKQASTTGTIYGIYDMSGTLSEYTSGYMKQEDNETLLTHLKKFGYGFIFTDNTKTQFVGNTPYVTEYPKYESGELKAELEKIGRYGDAYLETWNWFGNWTDNDANGPFTTRGASWYGTSSAGVFAFDDDYGNNYFSNKRFPFDIGCAIGLWC